VKVSGFTILRHAGALGYPFIQSIQSVLPLVDEFIVAIADDDAETASAVEALNDTRITIVRTAWHPVGIGGVELARQTNIALGQCTGTWAIYAQADELIHEDDYDAIRRAMRAHLTRDTEGLLFDYRHFYRSFRWIADDWRGFYPCAVRVVRTGIGIESAGDAAGFVRRQGHTTRGLIKSSSGARIFHYGWAGSAESRLARAHVVGPMFDGRPSTLTMAELFPPNQTLAVRPYAGTHPSPIKPIVAAAADAFAPPTITSSPAWLRAWSAALRDPQSARGWARVLLPTAFTNARWRLIDRVRDVRQRRANARRAAFYRPFISPSDLVFDVGANLGTHSVCFRALGARVVAFEPQPHCAQVLAATFAGDARVTLVQAAVVIKRAWPTCIWAIRIRCRRSVSTGWTAHTAADDSRRTGTATSKSHAPRSTRASRPLVSRRSSRLTSRDTNSTCCAASPTRSPTCRWSSPPSRSTTSHNAWIACSRWPRMSFGCRSVTAWRLRPTRGQMPRRSRPNLNARVSRIR
jgi:hypothetical protein